MSLPEPCCTIPPVVSNYNPKGREFDLNGMSVYETADQSPTKVLICAYDIFGVHPNIRQFADILSLAGYLIAVPDFFRGHELDKKHFPPKAGSPGVLEFIDKHGKWDVIKNDFLAVIEHYKTLGIKDFGVFGFCYGGRVAIDAGTEVPEIKAAGLVHPSLWTTEDAEGIKVPTILMPAQRDDDMIPFLEILKKNLGPDKCAHHRFYDVDHGFCGARGDFTNELIVMRIQEAVGLLQDFFGKHV